MKKMSRVKIFAYLLGAVILGSGASTSLAQGQGPADRPAVTVRGQTYTPRSILARNMGTPEDQTTAFPPHRVIGNIYYVGTRTLSSFLVVTPQGNILIDSTYERNVRTIEKSVAQLGFKFSDIKILLGNHAHGDHQEGDALVKELTGAQVMVMAEDVPALQAIRPGGKEHPIDRMLHDGESVTLGGTTLVAHLTAGHTRGCTTWTTTVQEGGRTSNVVFACSLRAPAVLTPALVSEFNRSFALVRSLPCDVPLGDHPAQYNMHAKHAKLQSGGPNPFIDAANCTLEADIQEAMYRATLDDQRTSAGQGGGGGAPAPAFAQEWTEFASREDRFTANFPGQPKVTETTWTSEYGATLRGRVYGAESGPSRFSITVVDYNPVERILTERAKGCPVGAETCRGIADTGVGYWKNDVRGAVVYATSKLLQRPGVKLTHMMWNFMDMVAGQQLQLTNADGSRTFASVYMHENKLLTMEGTVPAAYPEPGLFQQSLGWLDENGRSVRYSFVYYNDPDLTKPAIRQRTPQQRDDGRIDAPGATGGQAR